MTVDERQELAREEALRLLATVPLGRVVFTDRALSAIRPVNRSRIAVTSRRAGWPWRPG